jgi:subtilisin family serine protease
MPSGAGARQDAITVRFADGTAESAAAAALAAAGAVQVGRIDDLNTVVVAPVPGRARGAVHRALVATRSVVSVEDDQAAHLTMTPDDTYWPNEWYAPHVHLDTAWDITTGANGPVVAVLDTGVQASQPDLIGRVLPGRDFVNNDWNAWDDLGHGTKVAGVIAGQGMNATGVAGACWDCRILPVKVADRDGNVALSNAAAGLVWATNHGARVVNMSWGKTNGATVLEDAVMYARRHGVVLVASAGNEGNRAMFYPAAYRGVLSVAATDVNDVLASWSTHGLWVRLAAPACAYTTMKKSTWGDFCGTSASAPIVSGIAALILAYKPDATRADVTFALTSTAVPINVDVGGGLVDAYAAVHLFEPPPPASTP